MHVFADFKGTLGTTAFLVLHFSVLHFPVSHFPGPHFPVLHFQSTHFNLTQQFRVKRSNAWIKLIQRINATLILHEKSHHVTAVGPQCQLYDVITARAR